jgi:TonB-linked SusC/RagA family outer membrane protein
LASSPGLAFRLSQFISIDCSRVKAGNEKIVKPKHCKVMHFKTICKPPQWLATKTLLVMKLTSFLLLAGCLQLSATGLSQTITFKGRGVPLLKVFSEIKKQTGYAVMYNADQLEIARPLDIDARNTPLRDFLRQALKDQPFEYSIENTTIFISFKAVSPAVTSKPGDTARPGPKLQGRVMDGVDPLGGATFTIRKDGHLSAAGTMDVNGRFRIMNLAEGVYILEVSFIGYERNIRQVTITDKQQTILVGMKKSDNTLDEIQTTAYSRTTKRFNTGDVTTINAEEIERNPVPNVLQALEGRVPGMFVTEQTGYANGAFQVQIRSLNTLSGQQPSSPGSGTFTVQPLYILDGVEYPAGSSLPMGDFPVFYPAADGGNALNYLDPSQIESINVLKGADATAIYGSRGAFGVILITTKKAKAGKPSLTLNVTQGITELGTSPKLMNTTQYLALRDNAFANDGTKPGPTDYDVNGTWDSTKSYDWKKFFLGGHAPTTRANATYTGGTTNSSYLIGANYSSISNVEMTKGTVGAGGMNFSMNTATSDKKLTMALSGSYTSNVDDRVPVDFSGQAGLTQAPDAPYPFLPTGKLNWANGNNPAAVLNGVYRNGMDNFIANTTLTITPVKGLILTAAGGYNLLSAKEFAGQPSTFFNPATFTRAETNSFVNLYRTRTFSADPRAEFIHSLGKKGRLDVMAGGSLRDIVNQTNYIGGSAYPTDQLLLDPALADGAHTYTNYNVTPNRYIGGFAIANFRWADKYILNVNGRRDGSSVFGNNRQFGNFWSVAGAWIISEEPWFKGLRNVIDFLKLKGSYGLVGGSGAQPYQWLNTYSMGSNYYGGGLGLFPQNLSNPYLHWETDRNSEAGLNFDLWKGVVNVDATYYFDRVGDQIISQPLASITGFTSFSDNSPAKIHTHGTEFMIITQNIRKKDFSWSTRINLTIPRTKLVAYPGLGNLVSNVNYVIGKPITGIKVFRFAGVDPATGVYNFINAQGVKGEFTPIFSPVYLNDVTDRTQFVDLAPNWYGGILNSLTYKRVSLDFLVSLTDRKGPNYLGFQDLEPGAANANFPVDLANRRWMKPGDITTVPKATAGFIGYLDQINFVNSTGSYSNATYARLQNLSLSYKLPSKLAGKAHMASLSVFVAGQNLLTISKYGDLDPENMQAGHMPPLRVFTGGLKVTF